MKARTVGDAASSAISFSRPTSFSRRRVATRSGSLSVCDGSVANHVMSDFNATTSACSAPSEAARTSMRWPRIRDHARGEIGSTVSK